VTLAPARTLASAGTAGAGALAAIGAFLLVRGVPGSLYAAGIFLAAVVGTVAIRAGRREKALEFERAAWRSIWRREPGEAGEPEAAVAAAVAVPPAAVAEPKPIEVTYPEAVASSSELEEHRTALVNLGAQLTRESEAARRDMQRLEMRIRELEVERDGLLALLYSERTRFDQTLDRLCDGLGAELAELEPALEALIPG
jgi:hypothetical protein